MREEISEWEVDSIKPVSNQFKTTFYPPAIMECRLCRTTSGQIFLTRPSVSSCVRHGCNPLKRFPGFSIWGLTKNKCAHLLLLYDNASVGHRPRPNRVTWETPSREAIPFLWKPLGVRASYATRRKRKYKANKCGWTQPLFRKARDRGIN